METGHIISTAPLFKGLPETQLRALSHITVTRGLARGEMVFSEGDEATGFYVILSGKIKIYKLSWEGKEQILHIFGPGDPFGEVAVFSGERFPAHAEALEKSEVMLFPRQSFVELIGKDPSLAMNMLALLSLRLKHFTRLIEDLSLKEVPQRLASYLLYLGENRGDGDTVALKISKGQLASLLGTIPETLSRILNKLTSQQIIMVEGRKIQLMDCKALNDLASGEKVIT